MGLLPPVIQNLSMNKSGDERNKQKRSFHHRNSSIVELKSRNKTRNIIIPVVNGGFRNVPELMISTLRRYGGRYMMRKI